MRSAMADILESVIWLAILLLVIAGGIIGFSLGAVYQDGGFVQGWFGAGIGVIVGICISSLFCGPIFVLLQIRDSLKAIEASQANKEQ